MNRRKNQLMFIDCEYIGLGIYNVEFRRLYTSCRYRTNLSRIWDITDKAISNGFKLMPGNELKFWNSKI